MNRVFNKLKKEDGFTLIEMSVVIIIIAILLLLIIPNVKKVEDSVNKTTGDAIEKTIETQKVLYQVNEENALDEDVTAEKLFEKGYITKEQKEMYDNRKNKDN